jgi:hypothetical protein
MLLHTAPQDQAILSNVGEVGDFKIKASAKAFSILSSGLYANKIRAIVRELSCNAVDSHVAAGKQDTPFDVHLPNDLEPWFSIRDYGTGLSYEQVTQIYTTYFESTKTASNEFIGALGLGSKSPFAYTDNFTVTAIQGGKKGIYTAFINAQGVPSIAQMMTEDSDEPNGVEVKFSVNDRYDYSKFRDEARQVYTYFKMRPVVSGYKDFEFHDVEYETENIIPGVHSCKGGYNSKAIMGNIAYPIDIPNADKVLGELRNLLGCALEFHFEIGELDFQASREGLSYIPQTIDSIKRKLEAVNAALTVVLAREADAVTNDWERALFLQKKKDSQLWSAAVTKYVTDKKPALVSNIDRWNFLTKNTVSVDELAKKYNIVVSSFGHSGNSTTTSNYKSEYDHVKQADGTFASVHKWQFPVDRGTRFVINDLNVGATERAKFHWKNTPKDKDEAHSQAVYVLSKNDKTTPMNTKAFFAAIHNPPEAWIQIASALKEKTRVSGSLKNVSILSLQERNHGGYYRAREMVWRDAGKADSFDTNKTHYYLPLSGFNPISKMGAQFDVKRMFNDLKECGVDTLRSQTIYGVRKGDIEFIQTQKNWINIEDHIAKELSAIDNKLVMSLVLQAVDNFNLLQYNSNIVSGITTTDSPYVKLVKQFEGFEKIRYSEQSLKNLCRLYAKNVTFNPQDTVDTFMAQCKVVAERYPLLQYLRSAPNHEVGEYINLIDTQKGTNEDI